MVSKSEKDGGLDDKSSKVSKLGSGDVGGVWKSSTGVSFGDCGEVDSLKGLVGDGLMAMLVLQCGGEGGGVARLSKS
jgi:hypothetical protein